MTLSFPTPFRRLVALALMAGTLLLAGCQSAFIGPSDVAQANRDVPLQSPIGALPAAPVIGSTDYRVGPLDVLDVEVFGVEQLTRTVRISAGGQFTMPFVGVVEAEGKTTTELETQIAKQLSENFLERPQVTVYVKEYNSQRVTVEGAVKKPGIYSLTGRTSLLQVIALSEGLDELANPGGVVIYRNVEGTRRAAVFDIRKVRAGELVDPEVLGSDIVVVDISGPRSSLRDFLYSVPAFALFLVL
jgi:polysaccharide biosynthesis/export protein